MLKRNVIFAVLSASTLSIAVQAHWADEISKNEKAAFCSFYASLASMLTSLEMGENPEGLDFDSSKKTADVSEKSQAEDVSEELRNDFEKKWERVARKKNLRAELKRMHKICLKNSSSPEGKKKCKMLMNYYKKQFKEELLAFLALVQKKNEASGKNYRFKNNVGLVPCRDKQK